MVVPAAKKLSDEELIREAMDLLRTDDSFELVSFTRPLIFARRPSSLVGPVSFWLSPVWVKHLPPGVSLHLLTPRPLFLLLSFLTRLFRCLKTARRSCSAAWNSWAPTASGTSGSRSAAKPLPPTPASKPWCARAVATDAQRCDLSLISMVSLISFDLSCFN